MLNKIFKLQRGTVQVYLFNKFLFHHCILFWFSFKGVLYQQGWMLSLLMWGYAAYFLHEVCQVCWMYLNQVIWLCFY